MKHKRNLLSIAMASIMLVSLCAVVGTTSVSSAISTSKASEKVASDLTGAPIAAGTSPAACVLRDTTSMYVFVEGHDGALWYRIFSLTTRTWNGGWISLGGRLTSSPAAVSRQVGTLDVYVRGTNGAVWQKCLDSAGWHSWVNLGGQVAANTAPAACGWPGREDLFVQGTDGALWHKAWTGTWSGWQFFGGRLTSSPGAVFNDVYVRGTDGAVYTKWWTGTTWSTWRSFMGGQLAPGTGPALCGWAGAEEYGREDIFVKGTSGALYQKTLTPTSWIWSSWKNLGGGLSTSPTATTFPYNGYAGKNHIDIHIDIEVLVCGTNGSLYLKEFYNGVWHDWVNMGQGPP